MMRRRLLTAFFLFMVSCTVISRVYDSVTVPKVTTTSAKRKSVETRVEGTGTVKVKEKKFCSVWPGLRVRQTAVIPGSQVKEGDALFWYDMESIMERQEELLKETEKISLNIEKEEISQGSSVGMTQTETARWELDLAMRELETGQREYEEALALHEEELEQLRLRYEEGLNLAEEDLWQQQERDEESARQELENVKASGEEALRAQSRKIEDLEDQLSDLSEDEEESRERLERQIERAREDLESMADSWEEREDTARYQLDLIQFQEDRIRKGQTSIQETRRENYEAAVKQEKEQMKAAEKSLEEQRKAVEQAQWQLGAAQREDAAAQVTREQQQKISRLTVRGLELDKKEIERELEKLEKLAEAGGEVTAFSDGTVVDMELVEGKTATGEELLSLTVEGAWFEGTFLKEEQALSVGDTLQIAVPGTARHEEAVIGRMNLLEETEGIFQAELVGGQLELGTVTSYSCARQSDLYDKVIPLSGLRKDMKGYYCLVARTVSTILGEEFRAERVDVQVLFQGYQEAAIDGAVFDSDRVITGENQLIGEGSRVRPVSGF